MKRLTHMMCGVIFLATTGYAALATDLPRKGPAYIEPFFSWSGFYLGLNGGYGWGTSNWTATAGGLTTGDFNISGALAGGTIGYNLQTGVWVWGVEGDLDASWIKGSTTTFCAVPCTTENKWLATARGRVGYAWNRWLPYITGGAAFGDIKITGIGSESDTKLGWTAGAGLEYAFLGAWSAKLEYLYVDLGTVGCSAATCAPAADVKFNTNIVRAGVNYRF
jgi:outer membrane immunogenic protein